MGLLGFMQGRADYPHHSGFVPGRLYAVGIPRAGSTDSFWLIQQKYICLPVPHLNELSAASQFVQKSHVNEWAEWN